MKKLKKIQINPEKLMTNEELITLRGGYGYVNCGDGCGGMQESWEQCSNAASFCDAHCPGWTSLICVGV
jgi:hypothetical protein